MNTSALRTCAATPGNEDREGWLAIGRYAVRPAPGGLALVHEFLATGGSRVTGPDLLGSVRTADAWGTRVARLWSSLRGMELTPPALTEFDALKLRELRDVLSRSIGSKFVASSLDGGAVEFSLDVTGRCLWIPSGDGWRWYWSAILGEVLLSQHDGTWERLKRCGNHACGATFYDSTWNAAARWHNGRTCGSPPRLAIAGCS